jgi:hypothetical protein
LDESFSSTPFHGNIKQTCVLEAEARVPGPEDQVHDEADDQRQEEEVGEHTPARLPDVVVADVGVVAFLFFLCLSVGAEIV